MCGRVNVTDSPAVRSLMVELGMPIYPGDKLNRLNVAPGALASYVVEQEGDRELQTGYWSLLIEPKPSGYGYRPNPKFKTFNAQSRRLESSRLWKAPFKSARCVVPVSGFHEWKGKQCYNIAPADGSAMALAGLHRTYKFDDELVHAFTVITLPPQKQFTHIHAKSFPLTLLPEDFNAWLDPDYFDPNGFNDLLASGIRYEIEMTPIESPQSLKPTGTAESIV